MTEKPKEEKKEEKIEPRANVIICEGCGSVWIYECPNKIVAHLVECPLCYFEDDDEGEGESEEFQEKPEPPKLAYNA
jgi:hypothetical protein